MSKIYTLNNGNQESDQIPSIEYLNEILKIIEDTFISIDSNFNGFPSVVADTKELKIDTENQDVLYAKNIKTDSEHRFINEIILTTLIDKPSRFEIEQSLSETKQNIENKVDETYMKIVNTPNVLNKLRDISIILNENKLISGLLNAISNKVSIETFKEHSESIIHMNNNDRKALNILLKCVLSGFADWDAEEGACNAIINKPASLPANGGNADTVSNHGIKDLINKDDYDLVIGSSTEKYSKDSCDIYAEDGLLDEDIFEKAISLIKDSGIITFKRGYYNTHHINIDYKAHIIFNGADSRLSLIHADEDIIINNATFKCIGFNNAKIYIKSNCELKDIRFKNCEIILNNSENCKITDCVFDGCTIKADGNIINNIIVYNRYIQTKQFNYIGGNNIIKDNI